MYPPQAQYSRLPTDPENTGASTPSRTASAIHRFRSSLRAFAIVRVVVILLVVALAWRFISKSRRGPVKPAFAFDDEPRPTWLDTPPPGAPLRLRVAVISRANEFDRRSAIRDSIFRGVPPSDVKTDFKFFVGAPTGIVNWWSKVQSKVEREMTVYGDVVLLKDIDDIKERLSEKRFAALKWGGSVPRGTYDWFMTLDSDTFVRFSALARRLPTFIQNKNINPQNQSVLLGRMGGHLMYYENRVPDGNKDSRLEDLYLKGPWYSYPIGIGYMLSPFLVDTLLSMDPPPPHHIHYPNDDVMIGAWIAGLKLFQDKSIHFESTPDHPPKLVEKVVPKPYLPHPIDTEIIDDKEGWHNYAGRQDGYDASFSWSSVCIHHVSANQMRMFRAMDVIAGEWIPDKADERPKL
ncbi:hypothetical protein FA13DRAFT_175354 [Coprinellus micaceus]|uniref:Hexosyltransferase n=1 Tax=Coprinellus micaceus TaxID=71717 RepID=A0A4Y7SGC9_COPMI|nr:hypothetical protein FA13DRAFT_175354 [Coprinellus micaceus]